MNARFWIYWNEPTKITLKPGQRIQLYRFEKTEEGYHEEWMDFEYFASEGVVFNQYGTSGRDCDGGFDTMGMRDVRINQLRAVYNGEADVFYPEWRKVQDGQRDFSAEKAGY